MILSQGLKMVPRRLYSARLNMAKAQSLRFVKCLSYIGYLARELATRIRIDSHAGDASRIAKIRWEQAEKVRINLRLPIASIVIILVLNQAAIATYHFNIRSSIND